MELMITTQLDPGILPEIQWNNKELKQEIEQKAKEYANIVYSEAQEAEMRKDRATLNRLVTAFETQRKQVKKFYQSPYEKFEAQVKEVLAPVRDAIGSIDNGLAEIDRQYRVTKTNKMQEFYEKYVGDLKGIVPFQKTVNEENYRKSVTDKKLEQYYTTFFKRVDEDMEAIEELPERFLDKALLRYADTLSLTEALREGKRLEALEAELEARRNREKQQAAATHPAQEKAPIQEAKQESTEKAQPQVETAPQLFHMTFYVTGTYEQLMGLRQYMNDNKIQFGKAE